jgi:Protein of unknown function (DUF3108)
MISLLLFLTVLKCPPGLGIPAFIKPGSPVALQVEAAYNSSRSVTTVREKLDFRIYWYGMYVGHATLVAMHSNGAVTITSSAHSAPFLSVLYKVDDFAESRIMNGAPLHFRIKQHEGRYRSDKETIFDLPNRKVTFFNYLKNTKNEHIIADLQVWDVLSGFYYLRTQILEVGKTVFIDVFDSNKLLSVAVHVLGKERIVVSEMGAVDTVKIKPVLQSDGLFQKKGDVFVWLTDDESKVPVKVETEVPVGKVTAKLVGIERGV